MAMGLAALWLLVMFAVGRIDPAYACSCFIKWPDTGFADADVVFMGIRLPDAPVGPSPTPSSGFPAWIRLPEFYTATFAVAALWKGDVPGDRVDVETAVLEAGCGYRFEVGGLYVVRASADEEGTLHTGLCSGNVKVTAADALPTLFITVGSPTPVWVDRDMLAGWTPLPTATPWLSQTPAPTWEPYPGFGTYSTPGSSATPVPSQHARPTVAVARGAVRPAQAPPGVPFTDAQRWAAVAIGAAVVAALAASWLVIQTRR
jgi:hypothetical protein